MRISDWSSDVCSSDLPRRLRARLRRFRAHLLDPIGADDDLGALARIVVDDEIVLLVGDRAVARADLGHVAHDIVGHDLAVPDHLRSEEHTSELQSLMRISYAVFCLKKNTKAIS